MKQAFFYDDGNGYIKNIDVYDIKGAEGCETWRFLEVHFTDGHLVGWMPLKQLKRKLSITEKNAVTPLYKKWKMGQKVNKMTIRCDKCGEGINHIRTLSLIICGIAGGSMSLGMWFNSMLAKGLGAMLGLALALWVIYDFNPKHYKHIFKMNKNETKV